MNKDSTKYQVESSPAIKASTASYDENYILSKAGTLNIYGNCSKEELKKVIEQMPTPGITLIQFARQFKVKKELLLMLNDSLIRAFPNCSLAVNLNGYGPFDDLSFLEYLRDLTGLRISVFGEVGLEPINKYCTLNHLAIGGKNCRIEQITHHESIESLFIFENVKDIELIGRMRPLKKLTISKMTLKDLNFLKGLSELVELHFMLGGTKNLEALPAIGRIEVLSFAAVRQLRMEHLKPINGMSSLKKIKFERQPHLLNLDWLNNKDVEIVVTHCKNYKKDTSR